MVNKGFCGRVQQPTTTTAAAERKREEKEREEGEGREREESDWKFLVFVQIIISSLRLADSGSLLVGFLLFKSLILFRKCCYSNSREIGDYLR